MKNEIVISMTRVILEKEHWRRNNL